MFVSDTSGFATLKRITPAQAQAIEGTFRIRERVFTSKCDFPIGTLCYAETVAEDWPGMKEAVAQGKKIGKLYVHIKNKANDEIALLVDFAKLDKVL